MSRVPVRADFYTILGVPNFSEISIVRKAYRAMALKHHPDRGGDMELMKKVNEAYDVLMKYKGQYDRWLRSVLMPRQAPIIIHFGFTGGTNYSGSSTTYTWTATS